MISQSVKEVLTELRSLGVKSVRFAERTAEQPWAIESVEFFPSIAPLDLDSLVPPAGDAEPAASRVPPAFARVLKGSAS
jgi:hypothetical protein